MKQSRISAAETPGAVNFNLETLVRLAAALRVGLQVRFASFSEMLEWENCFSQDEFNVRTIDRDLDFIGASEEPSATEGLGQDVVAELLGGSFNSPKASGIGEVKISQNPPGGNYLYETVSRNIGQSASVH